MAVSLFHFQSTAGSRQAGSAWDQQDHSLANEAPGWGGRGKLKLAIGLRKAQQVANEAMPVLDPIPNGRSVEAGGTASGVMGEWTSPGLHNSTPGPAAGGLGDSKKTRNPTESDPGRVESSKCRPLPGVVCGRSRGAQ